MARERRRPVSIPAVALACSVACAGPRSVQAQVAITGAVSNAFINGGSATEHYMGWLAAADFPRPRTTSFVIETSGEYYNEDEGESYRLYTVLAGPKFTANSNRVRPFFQIPVGLIRYASHREGPFPS